LLHALGREHARHGRAVPLTSLCALEGSEHARDPGHLPAEGESLIAMGDGLEPLAIVERSGDALRVLRGFRGF
jgi:hypothetical protein